MSSSSADRRGALLSLRSASRINCSRNRSPDFLGRVLVSIPQPLDVLRYRVFSFESFLWTSEYFNANRRDLLLILAVVALVSIKFDFFGGPRRLPIEKGGTTGSECCQIRI